MNRSVDIHQSTAWWRSHRATSRCTAGSARRQRSGRGGQRVAWATPVCVALALPQLQPEQKAQGQHHCGGMPVQAWPQAALVLIPPQVLFGFLVKLLDRMAAMSIVDQLLQRSRGWQVTPIVLALFRLTTSGPLSQQPA